MSAPRQPLTARLAAGRPCAARGDAAAHGCGPRRLRRRLLAGALGSALLVLGGAGTRGALAADSAGAPPPEPQVGRPAPDFVVLDSDGTRRRLADFQGKVVVLEWTNADCPYTRKHYESGNMQAAQRLARDRGAVWLSVVSSAPGTQGYVTGPEANELSRRRHALPSAVLLDPEGSMGRAYPARTTPHLFVIDAGGVLRYMGGMDSIASTDVADIARAEPYLKEALLAVLDGQPVAHAVTPPYGCSVKYR